MNITKDFLKEHKKIQKRENRNNKSALGLFYYLRNRKNISHERKIKLKHSLDKAGIYTKESTISNVVAVAAIILNIVLSIYVFYKYYDLFAGNYIAVGVTLIVLWSLIFLLMVAVVWLCFYGAMDILMFRRKQKLEEVLPDYLQLVSSNIRAGMTIDQSLWFAVRPRFGILAKEIEDVAKHTFAGEPLDVALRTFVNKYNSKMLERSINLLIEGVRAGGEVGNLLDKISSNIQENIILKKEMAANVMTYVIFISFATVIAAPFLFGIATQLIIAISQIFSKVSLSSGASSGFSFSISEGVIDLNDFKTFAMVSLMITSFFSSIIISTIQKGTVKAGIKYIPMFMLSSILLFLLVTQMFSYMIADIF